jgi:hypothetical protein
MVRPTVCIEKLKYTILYVENGKELNSYAASTELAADNRKWELNGSLAITKH